MTSQTHLTPAGKEALRKTIRALRESAIAQLKEEAERVYRLGVPLEKARLPEARAKQRARLEEWADEQSRADFSAGAAKKAGKSGGVKKPNEKQLKELREAQGVRPTVTVSLRASGREIETEQELERFLDEVRERVLVELKAARRVRLK